MFFEEGKKRSKPTQALRKMVYARDNGICRICQEKVNPFYFEVGHDVAHSKGGKLTLRNAILLCPPCNKSMRTLTLKQARKALGLPEPNTPQDEAKKALNKLNMREIRFLVKNHRIKVKSKVEEGFFSTTVWLPSKRQYINALSKVLTSEQIAEEVKNIPKPEPKKLRKKE